MRRGGNSSVLVPVIAAALAAILGCILLPAAQGQAPQQTEGTPAKRAYSMVEYNNFTESVRPKDAAERITRLDAFVLKYPSSLLLPYVYQAYYETYEQLENSPKTMEYTEKFLSSSDKLEINRRFEATMTWARAYNKAHSDDLALAAKARDVAQIGLALTGSLERPGHLDEKAFASEMRKARTYLNATIAAAAMTMMDYKAVRESLGAVVVLSSYDPAALRPRPTGY